GRRSSLAPSAELIRVGLRPVATTAWPAAKAAFATSTPIPRPAPVMNQIFLSVMLHYLRLKPIVETIANDLGTPIAIAVSIDPLGLSWCKNAIVRLSNSLNKLILTRGDESDFRAVMSKVRGVATFCSA